MTDPVAGSFTGLHATVWLAGSRDYLVTTGGYDLENLFDNPHPSGDAMEHNVWTGRKLNSLSIERQMVDGSMISALLNATPYTGTVKTVVTAGQSLNTPELLTLAGTDGGNGILALTTAGATTTNVVTKYISVFGTDITGNPCQDVFAIPPLSPAATVVYTSRAFSTVISIDNPTALGTSVTCGIASVAGVTTSDAISAPALINVMMKLIHPVTAKSVIMTFNNCYIKKDPVDWKSGKTVSNKIELVMQNPNADISAQFA
jgi:hypothetical protein